jgi:polyisoprenyl-phosphate glycosyltransferase
VSDPCDVSVVIPTYRAARILPQLVDRTVAVLAERGLDHEVILVNDSSPDDTWRVIEDLVRRHPAQVRGIDLLHNHGQHVATMCGLAHARGNVVVTMDDDLQHPPEEMPRLLEALDRHPEWDAVLGRWGRDHGVVRGLGSRVHAWADRLANNTPRGLRYSAYRALRRPVVDAMVAHRTRLPVVGPLLTSVTNHVHNVDVRHDARAEGESNFRLGHGVAAVMANVVQGSTLPLRVMSAFGLVVAAAAFVVGGFFLVRTLGGASTPPGWASAFLATVFFGGVILVQIGLLGQYIHVIVQEVRQRPRWDVRRTVGEPLPQHSHRPVPLDVGPDEAGTSVG